MDEMKSPREAARPFTPKLTALVESPLYDKVWEDPELSKRDRSLVTVATLIALGSTDELPAHLRRAIENGVTKTELSALITHLAFTWASRRRSRHRTLRIKCSDRFKRTSPSTKIAS